MNAYVRSAMVAALVCSWLATGWWVVADHPFAGPVLFAVTEEHGVHLGDLPAVVVLAVASQLGRSWCKRTATPAARGE
jgi:hypothetical protein